MTSFVGFKGAGIRNDLVRFYLKACRLSAFARSVKTSVGTNRKCILMRTLHAISPMPRTLMRPGACLRAHIAMAGTQDTGRESQRHALLHSQTSSGFHLGHNFLSSPESKIKSVLAGFATHTLGKPILFEIFSIGASMTRLDLCQRNRHKNASADPNQSMHLALHR